MYGLDNRAKFLQCQIHVYVPLKACKKVTGDNRLVRANNWQINIQH